MIGQELIDELREIIKRPAASVSDTRLLRFVNWGQSQVADSHTFEAMRSLQTGSLTKDEPYYSFPNKMKDVITLRLIDGSNSRKLSYKWPSHIDKACSYPASLGTGRPSVYVDYGEHFEVIKIPNADYTIWIRCSLYPADLTTSTSTTLKRADRAILASAAVWAFSLLREVQGRDSLKSLWQKNYAQFLAEAVNSDHSAEDWAPLARPYNPLADQFPSVESWKHPFYGLRGVPG